ncbi:MAG TPA: Rho termination factor N-terminal domain-containing protein [Solirubrobacteraceae bacterium]|jgi:transcription termination factor Rho|nr:Rho termination factor N-terminal domain-containing protein [Solirubrobacteraceae bacterium]
MSVISRSALESSTLADLHEIGSELGLDGFRRLRKGDLIAAIIERQGVSDDAPEDAAELDGDGEAKADGDEDRPARRSRRGGRGRSRTRDRDSGEIEVGVDDADGDDSAPAPAKREPTRTRGGRDRGGRERGGRGRDGDVERDRDRNGDGDRASAEERIVSGTVELLPNGSGFVRVSPPEPSDDDVYISGAQVRRCELVGGDAVTGPVRAPRRSERYPSLVRVDTINGRAADEVAEGTKYDDLPCAWANERIALDAEDATLKAIEWLTPFGRGSRVVISGGPRAGKTEALRRLAGALARQEDLECFVVLAGVRPEEIGDWKAGDAQPIVELGLGTAPDAQAQAIERAVETGRRVAARGGHAVLLVDTLENVPRPHACRLLAAARNIVDGGSLTIIATAAAAFGGETTVIALDAALTASGRIPALDLASSSTLRAELLVGDKGAEAIAEARAAALLGA